MKAIINKYLYLVIGLILISIAFNLLCLPNNIVLGDLLGLTILLRKIFNFDIFMFLFATNVILIIISYIFLGEQKTLSATTYTILLPFFIELLAPITNWISITNLDSIIIAIIAGLTFGFGSSLIYSQGFTLGGTEIIGDFIKKQFKIKSINLNFIINIIIVIISFLFFNLETAVYALIAFLFSYTTLRHYRFGINSNKTFYIFSTKVNAIKQYINQEEKQDVTIFDVITGFKKEKKKMLMCVLKTKNYYKIRTTIEAIDPNAFITIADSYETINQSRRLNENE